MKKIILTIGFILYALLTSAQIKDTFDSNALGWNETVQKDGEAIITEGVMRLEGKNALNDTWDFARSSAVNTYCYAPIDVTKNFTIKCTAIAKKITDKGLFGIIFDQKDEYNQSAFYITKRDKNSLLVRYMYISENIIKGYKESVIKIKETKNAQFDFEIRSTFDRIEFYVNTDKAMELRYYPVEYGGFGFELFGQMTIDFDDVEFIQY